MIILSLYVPFHDRDAFLIVIVQKVFRILGLWNSKKRLFYRMGYIKIFTHVGEISNVVLHMELMVRTVHNF